MGGAGRAGPGNRRRVQIHKERPDAFTAAKKQTFLDHLAGCCNVSRAAEAAGVHFATVFRHRLSDPAFGQAFTEALETGYEALEAAMLERAAKGGYRPGDGAEGVPGPETVDTALAQFMLSVRHRGPGQRTGPHQGPRRATEKELKEAILAKLALFDASERKRKAKARARTAAAAAKAKAAAKAGAAAKARGKAGEART